MLDQLDALLHQFADWSGLPYDMVALGLICWGVTIFLGWLAVADQARRGKVGFRGVILECLAAVVALPLLIAFVLLAGLLLGCFRNGGGG